MYMHIHLCVRVCMCVHTCVHTLYRSSRDEFEAAEQVPHSNSTRIADKGNLCMYACIHVCMWMYVMCVYASRLPHEDRRQKEIYVILPQPCAVISCRHRCDCADVYVCTHIFI